MKNFLQTGDNLAFLASQIVAPQHAAGDTYTNLVAPGFGLATPINLVESGDPCVIGTIVGVANNDALTSGDTIIVSTRGVYNLAVVGKSTNGGNAAVVAGDRLYIDPVSAVITKDTTKVPFGEALGAVGSGATTTIPVKLLPSTTPAGQAGSFGGVEVDAVSGAIGILCGTVFITDAVAAALTLAAPTPGVDDGKILTIMSTTAQAHTVTTPANAINGAKHIITFGLAVGNFQELFAYNGVWYAGPQAGSTLT